jgi:sialate O-acetylesterase
MNNLKLFKRFRNLACLKRTQLTCLLLLTGVAGFANVRLPALIADNMILQQKTKAALWGWATPGEHISITASWLKTPVNVVADKQGNWLANITTTAAGGPYTLTFKATNTIEIKNVLLGEVWICSGQSNMEFTLAKGPRSWEWGVNNYEEEVAKINNPKIRMFTVEEVASDSLKKDTKGEWQEANPQNARLFSAVAYYYGREIFEKTGFPIAFINSTWGGTPAEAWTKKEVLLTDPDLKVMVDRFEKQRADYPQAVKQYEAGLVKWKADTSAAKKQNLKSPKAPAKPKGGGIDNNTPSALYNGMIAPVIPYTIKGFIWYQGESNADRAYQYRKLFPALIKSWRADWHNADLPFYFVQISPHYTQNGEIREAQLLTYETVPHTGMVVTTDNGDSAQVHPRNKELVGKRLALWPLSHDYGFKNLAYSGPIYQSMKVEGSKIRVFFSEADGGLVAKNGSLREFTIAGDDQVFHTAQAVIDGNSILVSSSLVNQPVAVRFAFRAIPNPNLYNTAGLPASPFRTDNWPVITQGIN